MPSISQVSQLQYQCLLMLLVLSIYFSMTESQELKLWIRVPLVSSCRQSVFGDLMNLVRLLHQVTKSLLLLIFSNGSYLTFLYLLYVEIKVIHYAISIGKCFNTLKETLVSYQALKHQRQGQKHITQEIISIFPKIGHNGLRVRGLGYSPSLALHKTHVICKIAITIAASLSSHRIAGKSTETMSTDIFCMNTEEMHC